MIGVFDSGSGGLTVVKAIRERIPSADILYFGDIGNAPYGSKPRAELSRLTSKAIQYLVSRGATRVVSACNSASASLAVSLFDTSDLTPDRLIEMVGPTVGYFRHADSRILLLATPATIDSGIYQDGFAMIGKEIQAIAVPELAGAIEFGAPEADVERIIRGALASNAAGSWSVVILACTHYPLVMQVFRRVLGPDVLIFDPAEAVADRVEKQWWPQEAGDGAARFVITKDSEPFRRFAADMFPKNTDAIEVIEPLA